ncbi:hypothetical protein THAOC_07445, partial [Thalassiosira oceanica]
MEDCIKRSLDRVAQKGEDASTQGDSEMPQVTLDSTTMHSMTEDSKSSESKNSDYDEFISFLGKDKTNSSGGHVPPHKADRDPFLSAVEAHVKSLKDPSTGVSFDAKLERMGCTLQGSGYGRKPLAMYCTSSVLKESKSQLSLNKAARSFAGLTKEVSFVLHMTCNVSGVKIASAIGESVKPRYNGDTSHVKDLEKLIIDGVNKKRKGQSLKGTMFGFDCSAIGVQVLVNGSSQGTVRHGGLGEA